MSSTIRYIADLLEKAVINMVAAIIFIIMFLILLGRV